MSEHYAHRHIRIDTDRDVVACLHCGQSHPLAESATVTSDILHEFIDAHGGCPNPFRGLAA